MRTCVRVSSISCLFNFDYSIEIKNKCRRVSEMHAGLIGGRQKARLGKEYLHVAGPVRFSPLVVCCCCCICW